MKSFHMFLLCAISLIAIVSVQPVMGIVDMNPFDTDVPGSFPYPFSNTDTGSFPYPFSNDIAEPTGNSDGFGSYDSSDWVFDISIPRTDGSTWQPYSGTPVDTGGWWSPLTPAEIPVSPTATPTPTPSPFIPGEFTIPGISGGWWSPLTPAEVPVSPTATPTPTLSPFVPGEFTIPGISGGWWSPLTPAETPVSPTATPTPTPTLTPAAQGDEPQISITALNLQGEYLRIRNNGMTPVVMTGYKITNGQGRSLTFIDWPRGDGSTFTFVLSPLTTVTVYYSREGTVTATELYWPTGEDAWSHPGDTAYLYDPQGRLVSSFTA